MSRALILLTYNMLNASKALYPLIPWTEFDEVLVIDEGSSDGTVKFYLDQGMEVVGQERPGNGEALALGVSRTLGDVLVFYTPNGQEDPRDIMRLAKEIEAGADLCIASRFMLGARPETYDAAWRWQARRNKLLSFAANFLFRRGPYISDTATVFRAFRRELYEVMQLSDSGSSACFQMSLRAMRLRAKITEIPTLSGSDLSCSDAASRSCGWAGAGCACLKTLLREIIGAVLR